MPFFLEHTFNPDFDYHKLRPREKSDGGVDHFELGYVQNVRRGDVLARWREVSSGDIEGLDLRHVYEGKTFPAGPNTLVDANDSGRLLAAADGYVFYLDGKITVKTLLNVRRDVDFHTGNIAFLGDLVLHGEVRSGFRIQARNILARGVVEGAKLRALGSIICEAGVKGSATGNLHAAGSMRLGFCENTHLRAGRNILVRSHCLHTDVYAGATLAVKGRLIGGDICCHRLVYAGEQLGGGLSSETRILLGYSADLIRKDGFISRKIRVFSDRLWRCRKDNRPGGPPEAEIRRLESRIAALKQSRAKLWERIHATEALTRCAVVVPGRVRPGVEIAIGGAYLKVAEPLENVRFVYRSREIVVESPALAK